MTTNGIVLERKLNALKAAGLDSLNISLDTLREDRFEAFTRRTGLKRVLAAIDRTIDMGFVPLKVKPKHPRSMKGCVDQCCCHEEQERRRNPSFRRNDT